MNLTELIDLYTSKFPNQSSSGLSQPKDTYKAALNTFARWFEQDDLTNFAETTLKEYRDWLAQEKKALTVHLYLSALKKFANWAIISGHLDEVVWLRAARYLSVFQPTTPVYQRPLIQQHYLDEILAHLSLRPPDYRPEELATMRHWAKVRWHKQWRDRALINVLADTGLRVSELLFLQREPFDHHQASSSHKPMLLTIEAAKRDLTRTVVISPPTLVMVGEYLKLRHDSNPYLFISHSHNKSADGKLSTQTVEDLINHTAQQLGYKGNKQIFGRLTPHAFRHALARRLRDNGVEIAAIAEILGHQSLDTTRRIYAGEMSDEKLLATIQKGWKK
jgi:integrase